jgi:signal transduction histidine kinase
MIASMTSARERIPKRDVAIAGVVSALGLLLMYGNVAGITDDTPPGPDEERAVTYDGILPIELAIPFFLLVTVPLLWRRTATIPAVGAALVGLGVNELLIGTEPIRCGVVLPTAFLFAFTAGAQHEAREARIGLALSSGLAFADMLVTFGVLDAFVFGGLTVPIWAVGRLARSRRRMADELQIRTAELREARDERARLEVATDRERLSRELDALLQRRLGELARMADAGAQHADAASATATLVDIERGSRQTLEEMRALVGTLRHDDSDLPLAPQPTLTHLEALLVRAKGTDARLTVEGSPRVLPPGVELSAYRIVEHLLAAIGDAPQVDVRIRFADNALELAVSGPARRHAKAAIDRARERARLQSGTVEATLHGGRAEAVVSLPVISVA